jgi:hypothetical protein
MQWPVISILDEVQASVKLSLDLYAYNRVLFKRANKEI